MSEKISNFVFEPFKFEGVDRLDAGFGHPNLAAAFFSCVVHLIWVAQHSSSKSRTKLTSTFFLLGEIAIYWILIQTLSRSGFLALGCSIVFRHVIYAGTCKGLWSRALLVRACTLSILFFTSKVDDRFALALNFSDQGVHNRIDLLIAGAQMVSVKPWLGWGSGNSGLAYMHWFQSINSNDWHAGMVNTYVQLAVEYGVPAFILYSIIVVYPVIYALCVGDIVKDRHLIAVTGAISCAYSVSALFTNFLQFPFFQIVPAILFAYTVFIGRWRNAALACGIQGALQIFAVLSLFIIGLLIRSNVPVRFAKSDGMDLVHIGNFDNMNGESVVIVPDGLALGEYYGKTIRSASKNTGISIIVYPVRPCALTGDLILLCGAGVDSLSICQPASKVFIFCPTKKPPIDLGDDINVGGVFLPEIDEIGFSRQWRTLAEKLSIPVYTLEGVDNEAALWADKVLEFIAKRVGVI